MQPRGEGNFSSAEAQPSFVAIGRPAVMSGQAGGTFSRGGGRPAGGAPGLPFTEMSLNGRGLRKTKPSPSPSPLFSFRGGLGKAAAPESREVGGGSADHPMVTTLSREPPKAVVAGGSSWKVRSSLEGPAGALGGSPGLLCKAGKAALGRLRILIPGCKASSVAPSVPEGAAGLPASWSSFPFLAGTPARTPARPARMRCSGPS